VLVVWEPILWSDWSRPSGNTMARISDRRALQFWDPEHLVAQELNRITKDKPSLPQPECCLGKGFHWDEAILYPAKARWKDAPAPVFWNGPVARIIPELEKTLAKRPAAE